MVQTKTKDIGGHKVAVCLFTGSQANRMYVRLTHCLDIESREIKVGPEEWQTFCIEFLALTTVDEKQIGRPEVFDEVFTGNFIFLFMCIDYCAEVNFGTDFLAGGGSGLTKPQEPQKTAA